MTYLEKLQDPRWQKKRLEVLNAANWRCEDCGAGDKQLQVHHCYYIKTLEPWEYDLSLLMCLCDACHVFRQGREQSLHVALAKKLRMVSADQLETRAWDEIESAAKVTAEDLPELF